MNPCQPDVFAAQLRDGLSARSVLVLASNHELARDLTAFGLEARDCALTPSALTQVKGPFDVVLCLDAPPPHPQIPTALARLTQRILFSCASDAFTAAWLRIFAAAGFSADLYADVHWAGPGVVLLRAGYHACDISVLTAELIRLRAAMLNRPSSGEDPEAAVRNLTLLLTEAQAREEAALEKIHQRISQLNGRTNQLSQAVQNILQSRIWRTLAAAGGIILRIQQFITRTRAHRENPQPAVAESTSPQTIIRVNCDEPSPEMLRAGGISGAFRVRGWAVAVSGVKRVETQIDGLPPVEMRSGLYRPDIAQIFPDLPGAEQSGFQGSVDTMALGHGAHTLTVRAISTRGEQSQLEFPLVVDHIRGYASDYHRWIKEFEVRDAAQIETALAAFPSRPFISIVVPVFRTPPAILEKTIASVMRQSYPDWELCLADDCSQSAELDAVLDRYASADTRIKIVRLSQNSGISAASNAALNLATGEFIALLDHDDELSEDALFYVAEAINRQPEADILYSDHDHLDEDGLRSDPFFKPDWSPDLALGENYVCHLMVIRTALARSLGGFRSEVDLSQDSDLLLRASRSARRIEHIPRVLYHWRTEVYSTSRASDAQRQRALETSRRAVQDHLNALNVNAVVEPGAVPARWRVRYPIPQAQSVLIVVPCGGKLELLERCLDSIVDKTEYPNYELVVVDNSSSFLVQDFVAQWSRRGHRCSWVDYRNRPFNFSAMSNLAVKETAAPLLLFLNDDMTVINPDWLSSMVELACRPEVGAVGAKLLFPDGSIQHAGVVLGLFGMCGHAFKGAFGAERVYFDLHHLIRNVSAVTGACLMIRTKLFQECGGFDEEFLPVAYQDIDLCLKLREKGYRILYTPHAQLYHYEAISKRPEDRDPRASETSAFKSRWKHALQCDPFYSPNLTVTAEDYSYRRL